MTGAGWPVRTHRTLIRSARADDLPALHRIVTLPEVARMLFLFRPGMSLAEMATHFPTDTATPPFRAVIEHDGRGVGSIGVGKGEPPPIMYFLDPAVAGQGLASEVVAAFADWLVARFGHAAITAEVFTDNPASRRVLEKGGFVVVGTTELKSAARAAPAAAWRLERR